MTGTSAEGVTGALEGLRVVEMGEGVSAAFCSKLFSDYGANVIKVETPGGDKTRRWGPFPEDVSDPEKSGLYFALNTNKRGVTLDVTSASGREQLLRLVAKADVLIENNMPKDMKEWGLTYETLSASNPNLVMISITPFGQTGPYANWNGVDLNAFHLTGTGIRYCGRPDEAPLEHGTFSADYYGAYAAAAWGLACILGRENAGGGQQLDVSCAEAVAATFVGAQNIGGYAQDGVHDKRTGIGMSLAAPATILPCKDGYVWMIALETAQWKAIVKAMGDPEWAQIDLFDDMFMRAQNSDMIYPMLTEWTLQHGKQEIMDICQSGGCPATAVYTVAEAADHPHMKDRGYIMEVDHPHLGTLRVLGPPVHLPACPGGPRTPAPLLGQHNEEVFSEGWGLSAEELETFDQSAANLASPSEQKLPLSGIRVVNFGREWLGPVAGQTLAFLGAEVYRVESKVRVDINRSLPPYGGGVSGHDRSLQNHAGWAGNGSITLNLKEPKAVELALELVGKSDVVIENFGPGVMEKLGLGYSVLQQAQSDVVMVSMPAAGLTGALKGVRTYGMSLSSITGLDSLTGYADGKPVPMENAYADPLGGIIGAFAVLLGLSYRKHTGKGQHVDYSQQEGIMQMVTPAFMDYVLNGRVAGPIGNRHPVGAAAPHGVFPCVGDDRWVSIAVSEPEEWEGLKTAMGNPSWATAEDFSTLANRLEHIDVLHEKLAEWTKDFDDARLAEDLQAQGVAAAPVLNVADLLNSPQYKSRNTFIEVTHPLGFKETIYGSYVKTSRSKIEVKPGPMMGRDNAHVFQELLGLSQDELQELIDTKVIF